METYTFLRELADSWVLLALTLFFIGAIFWAFRPGSHQVHADAANIPFRNDSPIPRTDKTKGCTKACPDCTCKNDLDPEGTA